MSLSRAFTMRTKKEASPPTSPKRALSKRQSGKDSSQHVNKSKISAPVELISTTNMISYTSPSLRTSKGGLSGIQTIGLGLIQEQTDVNPVYPPSPASSGSLPPLTPDVGPNLDDVLTPPATPPPNHLTDYFPKRSGSQRSITSSSGRSSGFEGRQVTRIQSASSLTSSNTTSIIMEEPKKDLQEQLPMFEMMPKRSFSTSSNTSSSSNFTSNPSIPSKSTARVQRSASNSSLRSKTRHSSKTHSSNPFAQELAKVSELAEDLGLDLDEDCMAKRGLWKYSVDEYMKEIYDVMNFPPKTLKAAVAVGANGWI